MTRVLKLLHMDLMGPMQVEIIARKSYIYVCVDDFSGFSWMNFLKDTSETFEELWLKLSKEHNHRLLKVAIIRSDHGKEFENSMFKIFFSMNDIEHEFSMYKNSQQNGAVETKNGTLQEMDRVMLKARNVPIKF